jgi:hypothetical protein
MSRLSEERIEEIALEFKVKTMLVQAVKKAVEKEAAIFWQERMRGRAATECSTNIEIGDACKAIRNLEIEEPK